jgi:hypothetical protein
MIDENHPLETFDSPDYKIQTNTSNMTELIRLIRFVYDDIMDDIDPIKNALSSIVDDLKETPTIDKGDNSHFNKGGYEGTPSPQSMEYITGITQLHKIIHKIEKKYISNGCGYISNGSKIIDGWCQS